MAAVLDEDVILIDHGINRDHLIGRKAFAGRCETATETRRPRSRASQSVPVSAAPSGGMRGHELLVVEARPVAELVMLAEVFPMVGGDDDSGVCQAALCA